MKKDRLDELKYILSGKNGFEYKSFYTERNIENILKYFGSNHQYDEKLMEKERWANHVRRSIIKIEKTIRS